MDHKQRPAPSWLVIVAPALLVAWAGTKVNGEVFSLNKPGTGLIVGAVVGFLIGMAVYRDAESAEPGTIEVPRDDVADDGTLPAHPVLEAAPSEWLAVLMLIIPAVAGVLVWQRHNLNLSPGASNAISFLAIISTSLLGYIDAKRLLRNVSGSRTDDSWQPNPPMLFVGLLAAWVVAFPGYFAVRRRLGGKNRTREALVVTLLFIAPALAGFFAKPELPTADAPEVLSLVVSSLESSPVAKARKDEIGKISISEPVEISYDRDKERRVARAKVTSNLGTQVVFYSVEWHAREKNIFVVQVIEQP